MSRKSTIAAYSARVIAVPFLAARERSSMKRLALIEVIFNAE